MNLRTTTIMGVLLFGVGALIYSPIGEAFAIPADIYIVNNLDVPLEFKEIKKRQNIQIKTHPPDKVEAGETGSFTINQGNFDPTQSDRLNVQYYVNNSNSGEHIAIKYKKN